MRQPRKQPRGLTPSPETLLLLPAAEEAGGEHAHITFDIKIINFTFSKHICVEELIGWGGLFTTV